MIKRKTAQFGETGWHSSQADRRVSRRFQVGWDVTIRSVDGDDNVFNETGNLNNLSSSGCYVNLTRPVSVGDKLEICIKIPMKKMHWIRYYGEVIHLQRKGSGVAVGIRFDKLRPEFFEIGLLQN
jgi:hypothetical protein